MGGRFRVEASVWLVSNIMTDKQAEERMAARRVIASESEESLRAALKHWNGMMVVDPATKNKKKKENKMVESRQYGCEVATIKKVRNGFIVYVGCETFVATKWTDVAKALEDYYKDPVAAEKKYCKGVQNG